MHTRCCSYFRCFKLRKVKFIADLQQVEPLTKTRGITREIKVKLESPASPGVMEFETPASPCVVKQEPATPLKSPMTPKPQPLQAPITTEPPLPGHQLTQNHPEHKSTRKHLVYRLLNRLRTLFFQSQLNVTT